MKCISGIWYRESLAAPHNKINKPLPKDQWIIVKNTHDAIIEQELWDKVQAMLEQKARPYRLGEKSIFAGKIFCAHCGYALISTKSRGEKYFKCPTHKLGENLCKGAFIKEEELAKAVMRKLRKLHKEFCKKDAAAEQEKYLQKLDARKKELQNQIKDFEQKSAELGNALKEIYLDKVRGVINDAEFSDFAASFRREKSQCMEKAIGCEKEIAGIQRNIEAGDNRKTIIERYVDEKELTQEMADILIKRIEVGKRSSRKASYPIKVHWKFDV